MDYGRFGRQIALPEIGPAGQGLLAVTRLRTSPDDLPLAHALWIAAGGDPEAPSLDVADRHGRSAPERLGVAAWRCVESARVALGAPPEDEIPEALLARLRAP